MSNTNEMLNGMVNGLADELKAVYNGEMLADEDDANRYGLEEGEPLGFWEFFSDVLDIDYIVSSDRETLRGVRLLVTFGGPNIYVNTWENAVEGYWWGDSARAWIPSEIAEAITDAFQEFWDC